jgi:hypothetical protein
MTGQTTTFDLSVEAGTTYVVEFLLKQNESTVFDLSGWNARLHVRKSYAQTGTPTLSFTSTPAAGLNIDTVLGKITLTISPSQTTPLVGAAAKEFVYDLEIYNGSIVYRPFKGVMTINPEVTKE